MSNLYLTEAFDSGEEEDDDAPVEPMPSKKWKGNFSLFLFEKIRLKQS